MGAAELLCQTIDQLRASDSIEVPLLPAIAQKAMQLAQDPDSDAAELANLIQGDQPLAAHVMRIANSAAYSPQGNIVSLQQAISRLGMTLIAQITLAASMNAIKFNAPGFESDLTHIKHHALESALWGKEIARKTRKNVEAAFIGGLLNTVGQPAIIQALVKKEGNPIHDDVMAASKTCYNSVTQHILQEWKMPNVVIESVCADSSNELAAITEVAMAFTDAMADNKDWESVGQLEALETINFYPEDILAVKDKADLIASSLEAMKQ